MPEPLIINTGQGLFCPVGNFFIDAWGDVPRNIVTHAHSDHARRGSQRYLCPADGVALLRQRLGNDIVIDPVEYRQELDMNGVSVSLHPAGHVLGSAQVRVEHRGEVWVFTGDYKRHADTTCQQFELVRCHTFITECTFGLPIFHWKDPSLLAGEINQWWRENAAAGRTTALFAYTLGKSQRLLGMLDPSIGPILLHGAVDAITNAYRQTGVALPRTEYASVEAAKRYRGKSMVIAPPSALGSVWLRKFSPVVTGVASGWMQVRGFRRRGGADRGFVLSDHADFPQLLSTIAETGAQRVIATHGFADPLVRLLRERGTDASSFKTRFKGEEEEVELAADDAPEPTVDAPPHGGDAELEFAGGEES
jgi:putative mRNA 3-end processing factor